MSKESVISKIKSRNKWLVNDLASGLVSGDISALSKAITLVESQSPKAISSKNKLFEQLPSNQTKTLRIAVTGVPGAGKSSILESLVDEIASDTHKVAILAIDPSSAVSKGSILGDKTRMEKLAKNPHVYIRPSPNQLHLGGLSIYTYESISLLELAGYNTIFVETVGVGQSEFEVKQLTDLVWMVLAPGGGDELQGIKKGIIEMADFIIVNKADGDLMSSAKVALSHYKNAHHYNQGGGIQKEFFLCSTYSGLGIKDLWSRTMAIKEKFESTDEISRKRIQQKSYWFEKRVMDGWTSILSSNPYFKGKLEAYAEIIKCSNNTPFFYANQFISDVLRRLPK
ncbi:MAG: methylmalonyl Co-A mutase-associated GTPase MeaB [Saprospiraceae bacterium]|nr:methylmalonyl Co-A mutase-associated GTPase MeaB [Saprospiraceae bacterium]